MWNSSRTNKRARDATTQEESRQLNRGGRRFEPVSSKRSRESVVEVQEYKGSDKKRRLDPSLEMWEEFNEDEMPSGGFAAASESDYGSNGTGDTTREVNDAYLDLITNGIEFMVRADLTRSDLELVFRRLAVSVWPFTTDPLTNGMVIPVGAHELMDRFIEIDAAIQSKIPGVLGKAHISFLLHTGVQEYMERWRQSVMDVAGFSTEQLLRETRQRKIVFSYLLGVFDNLFALFRSESSEGNS